MSITVRVITVRIPPGLRETRAKQPDLFGSRPVEALTDMPPEKPPCGQQYFSRLTAVVLTVEALEKTFDIKISCGSMVLRCTGCQSDRLATMPMCWASHMSPSGKGMLNSIKTSGVSDPDVQVKSSSCDCLHNYWLSGEHWLRPGNLGSEAFARLVQVAAVIQRQMEVARLIEHGSTARPAQTVLLEQERTKRDASKTRRLRHRNKAASHLT